MYRAENSAGVVSSAGQGGYQEYREICNGEGVQSESVFLVKVKAHRGEPANEEADIQADKAVSSIDVPKE